MKKVLALILIVLMLVLSGCESDDEEIPPYEVITKISSYRYIYNLQSSVIVCVVVSEPIWDEYYTMYGDGYEYEIYGDEIEHILISYQGTLMIKFKTGEVTYIYNYIAITFDV